MANTSVLFKYVTRAQYEALTPPVASAFYRVKNTDNSEDLYLGSMKLDNAAEITAAIEALDVTEFALGSKDSTTNVITLKGIKETDGAIASGTTAANDIEFAAVAATGAAEDVSIVDAGGYLTSTDVEGALQELASQSAGGVASKTVYGVDDSAGQSVYAKVYKIYQGSDPSDMSKNTLVLTINVPKDKVLQDASIVDITYNSSDGKLYDGATDVTALIVGSGTASATDAGKYLKMEMQNVADPLYVNLQTFVDVYTVAANATEVQLAVNNHEFSASIVNVSGTKVGYLYNGAGGAMSESVTDALTRIDGNASTTGSIDQKVSSAIADLDADLDASGTAQHSGTFVVSGVTEVDGVLTAVDSVEVEAAGAAAAAQTAAESYADSLASNYDPAGSAATAEQNAKDYVDGLFVWEDLT